MCHYNAQVPRFRHCAWPVSQQSKSANPSEGDCAWLVVSKLKYPNDIIGGLMLHTIKFFQKITMHYIYPFTALKSELQ